MKKIFYGMCLLTMLLGTSLVHGAERDGGNYGSKSDVTFYGKYEYPVDDQVGDHPTGSKVPAKPMNNDNNLATIPRLGDVSRIPMTVSGILFILIAVLLGKRKGINNES